MTRKVCDLGEMCCSLMKGSVPDSDWKEDTSLEFKMCERSDHACLLGTQMCGLC